MKLKLKVRRSLLHKKGSNANKNQEARIIPMKRKIARTNDLPLLKILENLFSTHFFMILSFKILFHSSFYFYSTKIWKLKLFKHIKKHLFHSFLSRDYIWSIYLIFCLLISFRYFRMFSFWHHSWFFYFRLYIYLFNKLYLSFEISSTFAFSLYFSL